MPGMMPFGLKIAIINRAFRKRMDEKAADMGLTSVQLRVLGSISRLEASGETEVHQAGEGGLASNHRSDTAQY